MSGTPPSTTEPAVPDDGDDHERRAQTATIKSLPLNRWILGFTALGVIIALVSFVVSCAGEETAGGNGVDVSGSGNNVNTNCAQVTTGSCVVTLSEAVKDAASVAGPDEAKFRQQLRMDPAAASTPTGEGPWPFIVVDTFLDGTDYGLFARTSNEAQGVRVGNTPNRSIVWVDCVASSSFTPQDVTGESNVGPLWAQVRWRPLSDGQQRGLSEPNQEMTAWMYRGTLEPIGHNGEVPPC